MTRETLTRLGTLCALTLAAPWAQAQSAAAAEALFQEGQAALERGDFAIACPKLRESDRLDPANGTKLNLADCEEKRGQLASAWELYRKVSDSLPASDERQPYAQQRAQALAPRVPRLTLEPTADAPPDMQASLDGVVFTSASFGTALPLNPGAHEVIVTGGGQRRTFRVELAEGQHAALEISPRPEPLAGSSADAVAFEALGGSPSSSDRGGRDTKTLGFVLGGVGVVGLGVGTITGIIGLSHQSTGEDNCSDQRRVCNQIGIDAYDKARAMRPISMIGFAVGIVGVGAGAYFVLTSSSDKEVALGGRLKGDSAALDVTVRW